MKEEQMPKRIEEETEMTKLADELDNLVSKHEDSTALDALLSVLAWKLVDVAEMIEKPTDEMIDEITAELKDAARQIIAMEEANERLGAGEAAEQGKILQ